jgi:hypothetical protein
MNKIKLKTDFHKLIDEFSNAELLKEIYLILEDHKTHQKKDILNELNVAQRQRLKISLKQAKENKTISDDEVKKQIKKWRSK